MSKAPKPPIEMPPIAIRSGSMSKRSATSGIDLVEHVGAPVAALAVVPVGGVAAVRERDDRAPAALARPAPRTSARPGSCARPRRGRAGRRAGAAAVGGAPGGTTTLAGIFAPEHLGVDLVARTAAPNVVAGGSSSSQTGRWTTIATRRPASAASTRSSEVSREWRGGAPVGGSGLSGSAASLTAAKVGRAPPIARPDAANPGSGRAVSATSRK